MSDDFRRAVSSSDAPRFWVDIPSFRDTSIATGVLQPHGFREGTSISLGSHALLHVSFNGDISTRGRAAVADYVPRCGQVADDIDAARRISLSPQERRVLSLIAEGATNADVAAELHIAVRTVATHVEHVLAKMQCRSRAHAAALAQRLGLI